MNSRKKIAIYSGSIPSTSFIEHLITTVAVDHEVLLFGTKQGSISYTSKHIKVIDTPLDPLRNIPITLFRTLRLFLNCPKLVQMAYHEAITYKGYYQKWIRFSRFIPVLLYRPDVFHLQWAVKINRWLFLKKAYNCKIVLSLLGTHINISPKIDLELKYTYEQCFPNVDAFHAVSKTLAKEATRYGVNPDVIRVIHTIVPQIAIDQFRLPNLEAKNHLNLLSVGRHHWVKGYNYAMHAIKLLLDQGVEVNYTIIAPNPPNEELLFLVKDLGLQDIVFYRSALPQGELFATMQSFDLLLQSSVSEGIANVVLEAMALGVPVISTDSGGMAEVVIPEITGWLVPVRDSKSISDAVIARMKTSQPKLNTLLINAKNLIVTNFEPRQIGQQFSAMYEQLKMDALF